MKILYTIFVLLNGQPVPVETQTITDPVASYEFCLEEKNRLEPSATVLWRQQQGDKDMAKAWIEYKVDCSDIAKRTF